MFFIELIVTRFSEYFQSAIWITFMMQTDDYHRSNHKWEAINIAVSITPPRFLRRQVYQQERDRGGGLFLCYQPQRLINYIWDSILMVQEYSFHIFHKLYYCVLLIFYHFFIQKYICIIFIFSYFRMFLKINIWSFTIRTSKRIVKFKSSISFFF